jgi:CheY-like chemotaxis protein
MNAILGLNEVLAKTSLNNTQQRHLANIRKSANALLSIINDILDFSKIEADKLEMVNANYSLRALIDNLRSMFVGLFKEKELGFNVIIDENLPDMVFGDENRVRQVITNLISNALKYTQRGQVDFHASLLNESDKSFLCFKIQDTGIGIKNEDRAKLFQPFEQLDVRKNRNVVGTGLGLVISYRLCRMMGGDILLHSVYGEGSLFTAMIPYLPPEKHEEEVKEEATNSFIAPGARILVVDDIDINLEVCAAMLEAFEIKPDLALSGQEALDMITGMALAGKPYQLIFMDHMMPGMDGIEATKQIRTMGEPNASIPVVALTANVINGAEEMFAENEFNGFLAKPIDLEALHHCLQRWLPKDLQKEI